MEIYCIKNIINGKEYVGITTNSVEKRFKQHCGANSYIGKAIRKHGVENFIVHTLDRAENTLELFEKEIYWIKEKGTFGNGYNLTLGGEGYSIIEPLEIKLDERQLKFVNWAKEENKKTIDVNNNREMIRSVLINFLRLFLTAEHPRDKRDVAKNICKLKPNYLKEILKTKTLTIHELKEWVSWTP